MSGTSAVSSPASSTLGFRDFAAYLCPGVVLLASYAVVRPDAIAAFEKAPLVASLAAILFAYISGHICKVFVWILENTRRRLGFSPYVHATWFDGAHGRWTRELATGIDRQLRAHFGDDLVSSCITQSRTGRSRRSELILLCWYEVAGLPSRALDEIDRYVALYNLSGGLVPAAFVFAIVSAYVRNIPLVLVSIVGVVAFVILWYRYEEAFCHSILRLWFITRLNAGVAGVSAAATPSAPIPQNPSRKIANNEVSRL
jgi:hypothetical protein